MTSGTQPRETLRAVCLPLDCPADMLTELVRAVPDHVAATPKSFETYCETALKNIDWTPSAPPEPLEPSEYALYAVGLALGLQCADPLTETRYEAYRIPGSAEQRMLQQPIRRHPGLSYPAQKARQYYLATVSGVYEAVDPAMKAEILGVLLTPPPADLPADTTMRAYEGSDTDTAGRLYAEQVDVADDGTVTIPGTHVSRACQLLPNPYSPVGDYLESAALQHLTYRGDRIELPPEHVHLKLAEYLWYGWGRLVNTAYNTLPHTRVAELTDAAPAIETRLYDLYHSDNKVFKLTYSTETENPLLKRKAMNTPHRSNVIKSLATADKRLLTIVDCIRTFDTLEFDSPIPVDKLYNHLRYTFTVPRRPGNDIETRATVCQALRDATDADVTLTTDETGTQVCSIPAPELSPYFPKMSTPPWDAYRRALAQHTTAPLPTETYQGDRRQRTRSQPLLDGDQLRQFVDTYHDSVRTARRVAVRRPKLTTREAVTPRVESQSLPELTKAECIFLTRVALTMERQLSDASLTRSMAPLRRAADGTELDLDLAKLKATEWLEEHDEGASVLYTVPGSKRSQLGVPNVSNDGFGERTPAEKSLHRKGVDQVAAAFAAMADVDLVVRYCDLWRLRNTACEPALAARDLLSTRVDVLAFDGTTPKYAAGIETESNDPAKPQRTVSKLTALTDPLETWLVTPNREHLWTVLRQVDDPAGVSFGAFPNSSAENYAPANWRAFLDSRGILGTNFTDVHTYRSLPNRKLGPESTRQRQKIIGHA